MPSPIYGLKNIQLKKTKTKTPIANFCCPFKSSDLATWTFNLRTAESIIFWEGLKVNHKIKVAIGTSINNKGYANFIHVK